MQWFQGGIGGKGDRSIQDGTAIEIAVGADIRAAAGQSDP
jgi:hypothetical protein